MSRLGEPPMHPDCILQAEIRRVVNALGAGAKEEVSLAAGQGASYLATTLSKPPVPSWDRIEAIAVVMRHQWMLVPEDHYNEIQRVIHALQNGGAAAVMGLAAQLLREEIVADLEPTSE